jgi:two-component system phosphate regulon sensor histidine kinase PhoR
VRRGKVCSILTLLFVLAGIGCVAAEARALFRSIHAHYPLFVGLTLLLLGATAGFLALSMFRKECRRLTNALRGFATAAASRPSALDAADSELVPLVQSINDIVDLAERSVNDAAMRLKELEIQLKVATAARQHAEAILYSISDGVIVTDTFDEIVLANEAAARTFDFDLAQVQSSRAPIDQVLRDQTMISLIREMRKSRSVNGRRVVEHEVAGEPPAADGDRPAQPPRTYKVTLSSVSDQSDEPTGVVAVLQDMTREREVAEMKNDFVSNVSHELRTPLASIKAYVEMLIDGEAEDAKTQREFYDVIQNEANRLGRLIDNILNISRIESGLIKINKQPQSLAVILKDALEVIVPQAKMKRITLKDEVTTVFYQTNADRDMLYQAVLNLLSNAVKYTPEGGQITVTTTVDEAAKKVVTRICDTGVGIPPKDLPYVFDKFYRAEANNKMAKGTGLGLSLVKHIVETVHKGRIFVESTIGKGSCFGFELELCE